MFNIDSLVDVLRREKCADICVIAVPEECKYVEYMVLGTGKSPRHLLALAEFVLKVYKRKMIKGKDEVPSKEGKGDWIALDLGKENNCYSYSYTSCILHLFQETSLFTCSIKRQGRNMIWNPSGP